MPPSSKGSTHDSQCLFNAFLIRSATKCHACSPCNLVDAVSAIFDPHSKICKSNPSCYLQRRRKRSTRRAWCKRPSKFSSTIATLLQPIRQYYRNTNSEGKKAPGADVNAISGHRPASNLAASKVEGSWCHPCQQELKGRPRSRGARCGCRSLTSCRCALVLVLIIEHHELARRNKMPQAPRFSSKTSRYTVPPLQ